MGQYDYQGLKDQPRNYRACLEFFATFDKLLAKKAQDVPSIPLWAKVLRSDTFWIVGAVIAINFFFTRMIVKQVKSKSNTHREKPAANSTVSTTTADSSNERPDEDKIANFRDLRCLGIILSSFFIPLQVLEVCWTFKMVVSLGKAVAPACEAVTLWKPYFLSVIVALLTVVLIVASWILCVGLAAYVLASQFKFIMMLIELPIPQFKLKNEHIPQPQRQEDCKPQPKSQRENIPQPQHQGHNNPKPQSRENITLDAIGRLLESQIQGI
ncbi:hypothetical protein FSARC_6103 [Fusarium sarcochroum]|uniref:Uncharacterized protein n=1 Tax=Fusarium sarcochroum TaxID=1208366 RepID=A0A8H4TYC7_9HYPO|nr:hypothetical protein FSARC_6103 [Fusarium sarcochroum]